MKTVWLSGVTCPVSFSITFSALPWLAWVRAMELDRPLAQITQPE